VIELVAVTAVIAILGAAAAAHVLSSVDHSRGYAAARYLAGRMALARTQAVSRGAAVGLRFTEEPAGFRVAVFQDGNGNGIRTLDVQAGVDRASEPSTSLFEQFPGVDIGLAPQSPATSAVQLGQTNILTFTPLGTATSGTIYIRDRRGSQWAVRVLGATGRTRVLRYDAGTGDWLAAQ
jgi:Tfp pilus assembly protein FimT